MEDGISYMRYGSERTPYHCLNSELDFYFFVTIQISVPRSLQVVTDPGLPRVKTDSVLPR